MENKARRMQRKVKAVNLHKASSVGIVFDLNSDHDLKHIKELVNNLSPNVTKVGVVGYLKGKKQDYPYISDKNYSFISNEDLNFFLQPNSESITKFLAFEPDILLILSQSYHFAVHYIARLSKAGLKVGQAGLYDDSLDFILEMHENSLEALTREIHRYLGDLQTA
jgi:hypothetical protein